MILVLFSELAECRLCWCLLIQQRWRAGRQSEFVAVWSMATFYVCTIWPKPVASEAHDGDRVICGSQDALDHSIMIAAIIYGIVSRKHFQLVQYISLQYHMIVSHIRIVTWEPAKPSKYGLCTRIKNLNWSRDIESASIKNCTKSVNRPDLTKLRRTRRYCQI